MNARRPTHDQGAGEQAMADIFTAIWDKLPLVLSGGFILVMLVGFWRGLRIKPRPAHDRAPERWFPGLWT
jgi:hypothetical protein